MFFICYLLMCIKCWIQVRRMLNRLINSSLFFAPVPCKFVARTCPRETNQAYCAELSTMVSVFNKVNSPSGNWACNSIFYCNKYDFDSAAFVSAFPFTDLQLLFIINYSPFFFNTGNVYFKCFLNNCTL